jgi:hypothetical protein
VQELRGQTVQPTLVAVGAVQTGLEVMALEALVAAEMQTQPEPLTLAAVVAQLHQVVLALSSSVTLAHKKAQAAL